MTHLNKIIKRSPFTSSAKAGKGTIMITNNEEQRVENAQRRFDQAKAQLEKAKRKLNDNKRKQENHHKYMMGGIVKKYFPSCMSYEQHELEEILSVAIATDECRAVIERITREAAQSKPISKSATKGTAANNAQTEEPLLEESDVYLDDDDSDDDYGDPYEYEGDE